MEIAELIANYIQGPGILRDAISGMTLEQIDAAPVPGRWSTRQIVCHLADFELVNAGRMKHVIAEDRPTFAGGFQQEFADHLAYDKRDMAEELAVIDAVRLQMARVLQSIPVETFERTGIHSVEGQMTLQTLLERITNHIPHHVRFIEEKKQALEIA